MNPALRSRRNILFLFTYLLFTCLSAFAQPAIEWDKIYEPYYSSKVSVVRPTSDGGIIAGRSDFSEGSNYVIAKFDAAGVKEWGKIFAGNKRDDLTAIIQTTDGGYLLGGSSRSNKSAVKSQSPYGYPMDYWIIKINSNGTKQWDKTFGGTLLDELTTLIQTSDGGYLIGGSSSSDSSDTKTENSISGMDYWVVKITSDGTRQWDKTIGGLLDDRLAFIDQTPAGNYILAGYSSSPVSGDKTAASKGAEDFWIVQLSQTGTKQWDKTIGGSGSDLLTAMIRTRDGGYLLGGSSGSTDASGDKSENGQGLKDFWVMKMNANWDKQWDKTFGGKKDDIPRSLAQTADEAYIIGGDSESEISGNKTGVLKGDSDYWVIKLNASGAKIWEKTVGAAAGSKSSLVSVVPAPDGTNLLYGSSYSQYPGNDKTKGSVATFWIVKLLAESNTKALSFSAGTLKYVNSGSTTTPTQSLGLSANTGTPVVTLTKSHANWLTLPAASLGSLPFAVNPSGLSPKVYTSVVVATAPGYARAFTKINLHVNDVTTPPTLNPIGYQEGTAGKTITFQAAAKISIGQSARFSLIGAPKGATIGASDGVFSWVLNQAPGIYQFVVRVSVANYPQLFDEEKITVTILKNYEPTVIRINAGGGDYTTSDGRVFEADKYYDGLDRTSYVADVDILNTEDDELYRSGRSSEYFNYHIPVAYGTVKVTLHFAETYWGVYPGRTSGTGRRRFDVYAEDQLKLGNYSIIAEAGAPLTAIQETFEVEVKDGDLNLAFRSITQNRDQPRLAAIEVEFTSPSATVILNPVADSYISYGANANTNYGTEPELNVKQSGNLEESRNAFLKFSLANFKDVASAKFRIYGYNQQAKTNVKLILAGLNDDNWTETGITANNAPAFSAAVLLAQLNVTRTPEYFEVDITDFAKVQFAGDKVLTLRIHESYGGKRIVLNSRENAVNRPELIVTTNEPVHAATRLMAEAESEDPQPDGASSVIYPNPVQNRFTLQIGNQHRENASLELFNEAGNTYPIKTPPALRAGSKTEINIADLSLTTGIYLLKVQSVSKSEVLKVVVTQQD
ncbi:CBM96 family carbohydrate-binding protein [Dyadobacter sediminis]|uniref:DNRLRE domain-containing protein n=1 Tax=Dyadobacter sediminis TaxID=1493691 RepID=A0A5R9KBE5_9BACT|nr:malectin domain-containing carbohydrate-binding protein [Dyadobacter sediminis]TLU92059.1 DNRLRE domain-containing protein [Dyadobacter sediminis]GGB97755.1 hypothetical protein GCM10011325_26360 [Dyadobacter sediminis]